MNLLLNEEYIKKRLETALKRFLASKLLDTNRQTYATKTERETNKPTFGFLKNLGKK